LHSARSRSDSVDVDRASAAMSNPATVFCAGHANGVSNYPEQGGLGFDINFVRLPVYRETEQDHLLSISDKHDLFGSEKCVPICPEVSVLAAGYTRSYNQGEGVLCTHQIQIY
jgi:hypothetical protein